ncbi:natriuretic peptides B [Gasterosteus aculeatus]
MPVQFLAYLHVSSLCIKEKRLLLWAPTSKQLPDKDAKQHPLINLIDPNRESQRNMHLSSIPLYCLLLILKLQLSSTYPITGLTGTDMDILKVLLHRLEESVPDVDQRVSAERDSLDRDEAAYEQLPPQTGLDEAAIREFLSSKNLKSVRNDSSRKSSSCFGRRMDRIGSMSSLGCNTVRRSNQK